MHSVESECNIKNVIIFGILIIGIRLNKKICLMFNEFPFGKKKKVDGLI